MFNGRYKQLRNPLLQEQQNEKEIRCDISSKLMKHELRKQEYK